LYVCVCIVCICLYILKCFCRYIHIHAHTYIHTIQTKYRYVANVCMCMYFWVYTYIIHTAGFTYIHIQTCRIPDALPDLNLNAQPRGRPEPPACHWPRALAQTTQTVCAVSGSVELDGASDNEVGRRPPGPGPGQTGPRSPARPAGAGARPTAGRSDTRTSEWLGRAALGCSTRVGPGQTDGTWP